MTPKEKAEDLIERMKQGCCNCPHDSKYAAEECVNEILKTIEHIDENVVKRNEEFRPIFYYEFWNQVKEEIQKL